MCLPAGDTTLRCSAAGAAMPSALLLLLRAGPAGSGPAAALSPPPAPGLRHRRVSWHRAGEVLAPGAALVWQSLFIGSADSLQGPSVAVLCDRDRSGPLESHVRERKPRTCVPRWTLCLYSSKVEGLLCLLSGHTPLAFVDFPVTRVRGGAGAALQGQGLAAGGPRAGLGLGWRWWLLRAASESEGPARSTVKKVPQTPENLPDLNPCLSKAILMLLLGSAELP